jgi:hypothetical protein
MRPIPKVGKTVFTDLDIMTSGTVFKHPRTTDASPEKDGVGGSIPSLAIIISTSYKSSS